MLVTCQLPFLNCCRRSSWIYLYHFSQKKSSNDKTVAKPDLKEWQRTGEPSVFYCFHIQTHGYNSYNRVIKWLFFLQMLINSIQGTYNWSRLIQAIAQTALQDAGTIRNCGPTRRGHGLPEEEVRGLDVAVCLWEPVALFSMDTMKGKDIGLLEVTGACARGSERILMPPGPGVVEGRGALRPKTPPKCTMELSPVQLMSTCTLLLKLVPGFSTKTYENNKMQIHNYGPGFGRRLMQHWVFLSVRHVKLLYTSRT